MKIIFSDVIYYSNYDGIDVMEDELLAVFDLLTGKPIEVTDDMRSHYRNTHSVHANNDNRHLSNVR